MVPDLLQRHLLYPVFLTLSFLSNMPFSMYFSLLVGLLVSNQGVLAGFDPSSSTNVAVYWGEWLECYLGPRKYSSGAVRLTHAGS